MVLKAALLPVPTRDSKAEQSPPLSGGRPCAAWGQQGITGDSPFPCPGARRAAWGRGRKTRRNSYPGFRWGGELGPVGRQLEKRGGQGSCWLFRELSMGHWGDIKRVSGAPRVRARCSPEYPSPGHSTLLTICATLSRAPWVRGYTGSSSPSEGWPGPSAPPLLHVVRTSPDPCDIARPSRGRTPRRPPDPGTSGPGKAGTGRGGASGAGRTDPSSRLWRDPYRTREQMPRKPLPSRHAEVGLAWAGNRTPGALASPWSAPPRSQLVTSLQGFCVCVCVCGCGCC